ncbi:MAG: hypothetical protein V2G48_05975 [bacterium JZ-2024 1]
MVEQKAGVEQAKEVSPQPSQKKGNPWTTLFLLWGVFLLLFFLSSAEMKNPNRVKGMDLSNVVLFDGNGRGHLLTDFPGKRKVLCIWKPGNPQNEDWLLLALVVYPEWKKAGWEWVLVPLDPKKDDIGKHLLPFPQLYDPLRVLVPKLNPVFLPTCYELNERARVDRMLPAQLSQWKDKWKESQIQEISGKS